MLNNEQRNRKKCLFTTLFADNQQYDTGKWQENHNLHDAKTLEEFSKYIPRIRLRVKVSHCFICIKAVAPMLHNVILVSFFVWLYIFPNILIYDILVLSPSQFLGLFSHCFEGSFYNIFSSKVRRVSFYRSKSMVVALIDVYL